MLSNKQHNILHAVVIKNNINFGSKAIIFDKNLGKIDIIIRDNSKKKLLYGSLIECEYVVWRDIFIIKNSSLMYLPDILPTELTDTKNNMLLFVHHWLELANIFLSYNQPNNRVYSLFSILYNLSKIRSITGQKLIIAHFFTILGIYPPNSMKYDPQFFCLILGSLDIMFEIENDIDLNEKLNRWIYDCIKSHSSVRLIRTSDFLKR